MTKGGRNLIILGLASVVIACATTGISLAVYHNSGDIYLDRSRPGFLPDDEEIGKDPVEENYTIEKSGLMTKEVVKEYIEALQKEVDAIDAYKDPFAPAALSDEKLGISAE